jgi:hypothetical protein
VSFAGADLDSSNMIYSVPLAAIGLTADTQFDWSIYAFDNYFSGNLTDFIENMTYTPSRPRFASELQIVVPPQGVGSLDVTAVSGGDQASPSQTGFLLLYKHSDPARESQVVKVEN